MSLRKKILSDLKVAGDLDYSELRVLRKLWEIDQSGEVVPEPRQANIRLSRGEVCYHACPAEWLQMRTARKHFGYVGSSIGFRVSKNVTLRFGAAVPVTSSNEELTALSAGDLFVTNKKLSFIGSARSTTVTYGRLARWDVWSDAISVEKSSGKPDVFKMEPAHAEYIDALLQAV